MEIPQMLFLLVVQQLETWKQTAALKWDLCLFPVQATEGQPGPANPSLPPTEAPALWARGEGPGSRVGSGDEGRDEGREERRERTRRCLEEGLGIETLPNVLSNAAPGENHQLCDLDQVTAPSEAALYFSIC